MGVKTVEQIIEVPKVEVKTVTKEVEVIKKVQKFVEVPQIQTRTRVVDVPEIQEVEQIIEVPKVEVVEKVVEQVVQKFVPKIKEVEQVIEIPRVEYKEVEGKTTTEDVPMTVSMVQPGTVKTEEVDGPDLEPIMMQQAMPAPMPI